MASKIYFLRLFIVTNKKQKIEMIQVDYNNSLYTTTSYHTISIL